MAGRMAATRAAEGRDGDHAADLLVAQHHRAGEVLRAGEDAPVEVAEGDQFHRDQHLAGTQHDGGHADARERAARPQEHHRLGADLPRIRVAGRAHRHGHGPEATRAG